MFAKEIKDWVRHLPDDSKVYLASGCLNSEDAEGDLELEERIEVPKLAEPQKDKASKKPNTLFDIPSLPLDWLVRLDGCYWLVPAVAQGWKLRRPYRGLDPDKAMYKEVSLKYAMGCGIPWQH